MKRLSLLFCLLFSLTSILYAQDNNYSRDEFSISTGVLTSHQICNNAKQILLIFASFGTYKPDSTKYSASINFNYFHYISKKVALGVICCYQTSSDKQYMILTHTLDRKNRDKYYSIIPAVKINFATEKIWRIYGKFGIGPMFDRRTCITDDTQRTLTKITMQCSFGGEYGKTVCAFAEVGGGAEGAVQAGVRIRLK